MTHPPTLNTDALVGLGKVLLPGAFGCALVRAIRQRDELHSAVEGLVIGLCGLLFFKSAGDTLLSLSDCLTAAISGLGNQNDLRGFILDAFHKASQEPTGAGGSTSFNLPSVIEQAWRTGVWGVMTTIVDWVFLMASFVLESAKDVLWKMLLFLYPVTCGVYPIFPRMMQNLSAYAVELALWFPLLALIEIITSSVAREAMAKPQSLGLYVVSVELLAIILTLSIPSITHKFLSGAFSGDFESHSGVRGLATRAIMIAKSWTAVVP